MSPLTTGDAVLVTEGRLRQHPSVPDPSPARRLSVLLLADGVREEWRGALTAAGLEVATTGWLDGVTAARLRRPDVVLVSTDLPDHAPSMVCTAFRTLDLAAIPVVVAGPGADRLDQESALPARADLYLPAPLDLAALAGKVRDAVREVPGRLYRGRSRQVVLGLVAVALLLTGGHALLEAFHVRLWGAPIPLATEWALFGTSVAAALAAVGVATAGRTRPFNVAERRVALTWLALLLWSLGSLAPGHGFVVRLGGVALALVALARWAWLGPRAKPRTPRVRRAFHLLAGALVLLAAALGALLPWVRA